MGPAKLCVSLPPQHLATGPLSRSPANGSDFSLNRLPIPPVSRELRPGDVILQINNETGGKGALWCPGSPKTWFLLCFVFFGGELCEIESEDIFLWTAGVPCIGSKQKVTESWPSLCHLVGRLQVPGRVGHPLHLAPTHAFPSL